MKNGVKICIFLVAVLCCVCGAVAQDSTGLPIERRMLFNAWLFLPAGSYYASDWVHEGPAPALFPVTRRMLLPGTNHYHSSGWRLTACRTGTSAGTGQNVNFIPPLSYSAVIQTNWQASLQNTLDAKIESPFYPEGIGTLYFDAINVSPSHPTEITVEIATNMLEYIYLGGGVTNVMYPVESEQFSNNWQVLDVLSLNAASSNDFTRYQRLLQCRTPARFRIRRTGTVHSGLISLDDAFTAIDNICASYPPADVVMEKPAVIFEPAYPAAGQACKVRCEVSNIGTNNNELTGYSNRVMTVWYRWRYLDQMSNAWQSATMSYVAASGVGNGELYEAVLPVESRVGDLEYYFVCDFQGYRYRHLESYANPPYYYTTEWLSPRTLRSDTVAEGGREFYTRLRPYPSPYETVWMVTGPYYDENPIPMTLISNDVWRGMIPIANVQTNLQFYFRGNRKYDAATGTVQDDPVYWAEPSQALIGVVPFGGVCAAYANRQEVRPMRVTALGGGFVQVTFDANTLEYMTSRAEYQNFNGWAAPPDVFTDSNGQVSKQRLSNTFDSWPAHGTRTVDEFFLGYPAQTNVYNELPYLTINGWLSGSSAYVVDRLAADVFNTPDPSNQRFRNVAIRLQGGEAGLGLGYIHNREGNTLPDGIDRISFKCRLGQVASPDKAIWYKPGGTMQNYLVRASVGADRNMSPQEPSLSVLGYYQDFQNFYEYRMTQVPDTANLDRDERLLHELYKWRGGVPYRLAFASSEKDAIHKRTVVELRMFTSGNSTTLRCKFGSTDNILQVTDDGKTGGAALTYGTCGFMSAECRSGFGEVYSQETMAGAVAKGGTTLTPLLVGGTFATDILNWSFAPSSRWKALDNVTPRGIYSVIPSQKLGVFLQRTEFGTDEQPQAPGTLAWEPFKEVTLTGFGYHTYDVPVYAWRSHFLMLRVLGRTDGQRVDVIVDEIKLSGWRGQEASDLSPGDTEANNQSRPTEWVASEAWVITNSAAGLNEGRVPGAFNTGQVSPMSSVQLSTRYANTDEGWVTNTTYVYNGWIYLDGAGNANSFAENFIGSVQLKIDGAEVLYNEDPDTSSTNTISYLGSGWYPFELRLGCGSDGRVGPAGGGLLNGLGVAYSRNNGASWVPLRDTGSAAFLRTTTKTVLLDHQRGGREIDSNGDEGDWLDQAIRSPRLLSGTGMLEFDYRVSRAPARLVVQFAPAENATLWSGIHTVVVDSAMSSFNHAMAYLGTNMNGYLRVVNDRSGIYTNALVEINNAVAWDEPVVEDADWRAYNVKVTDTDLQRIMLDETKACFLNNSQTAETDPAQSLHREAYVMSPFLPTGLGSLTFMARKFTSAPAPLFLYVTTDPELKASNTWTLVHTFQVTNQLYQTYSFTPTDGRAYRAVKLAVPTTGGGQRVCVEELAVTEPVLPGFEIVDVRALCAEGGGFSTDRFQPLHSDEVGFEARISNIRLSPQNIRLYVDYYVGTNVWGTKNWPAGEVVTLDMELVDEDLLLYRTDLFNVVPPQEKNQVVQYRVRATYEDASHTELDAYQSVFTVPSWYHPIDLNQRFAATGGWAAYYIVYDVPVGAIWLNEINAYEPYEGGELHFGYNTYVEIAVPAAVSLSGWHLDIVPCNDYDPVYTISFLGDLPAQEPVTNGYAFFVVGHDPSTPPGGHSGIPPLPKLDYSDQNIAYKFSYDSKPLGIRLRRPWGMYEHAVVYDRNPGWGGAYSGAVWVDENPERGFMYVGPEGKGGSLNVITNSVRYALPLATDWATNLTWTPGGVNIGQTVEDFNVMAPGVSNVVVTSSLTPMHGVQNGMRVTPLTFKLRLNTPTNILYEADGWYRIKSVTVNGVEHLTGGEVEVFDLPLLVTERTNLNVVVTFGLRGDVDNLNLGSDVLTWLMGFGDAPLAPTYYYGRELEIYERYWLNANPTTTNYLEGGILKVEREEATTNYFMTAWLALNGTNVPTLLGDRVFGDAVFKVTAKDSLTAPDWTMLAQYRLGPSSFDSNHTTRVFIQNPHLNDEFSAAKQLFFRWVIEYEDPRFSKPILVITNSP